MKRLSHYLLIAALTLALAACAGAPMPTAETSVPPEHAAPSTTAPVAKADAPEADIAAAAPVQDIAPEPKSLSIEEEEVSAPELEEDSRAFIAQARQALERGERDKAVSLLTEAQSKLEPGNPARLRVAENLVNIHIGDGRYSEVLALLTELGQPLDDCLLRSLALASEIEGHTVATMDAYRQLSALVDEMERDELNRRIGYLMDKLEEAELEALAKERLFSRLGGYAGLRLAKLRIAQERPEEAEPILWRLQFLFGDDPIGESADTLVRRLVAARTQKPGHFGVMLPLSGKLALFGQRVLRGVLLASELLSTNEEAEKSEQEQGLTLHIFDTRADPEIARQGVMELADKGVIGIIGPLKGNVAQAAAEEARALGVPLLTPTPSAEVEGGGVFRLALRPEDEIDRLARYAIEEAGIKRFAILAPDTDRGRSYRKIFWDSVIRYGGEIAGSALFEQDKNIRLEVAIAKVTGIHRLSKKERRELFDELRQREADILAEEVDSLPEKEGTPIDEALMAQGSEKTAEEQALEEDEAFAQFEPKPNVDFTGVFLPIGAKAAALLAPQLPYHDIFDTTLLGLRSWNHPSLVKVGRGYVNGALFPVEWNTTTPEGEAFAKTYKATYKRDPGVLEVYGFDAGTLALGASTAGPKVSRDEFQLMLSRLWAQQAVTGPLTTHPSGVIASEPKILTVHRGRFIPVTTSESN